jgi:hypothetical protein
LNQSVVLCDISVSVVESVHIASLTYKTLTNCEYKNRSNIIVSQMITRVSFHFKNSFDEVKQAISESQEDEIFLSRQKKPKG